MFNNFFRGKRVLITGHTGFKGSWLSIWLHQLGASVYGYALPAISSEDNFVACGIDKFITNRVGDVRNEDLLKAFFEEVQPHIAFHMAAQPLVLRSYNDPAYTFSTNLMGAVNFFEAVRKTNSVKVAINVTSDKCYENKEWVWGYRENDPLGGNDPYSTSKGCSELITSSYRNSFFLNEAACKIASVRAGNVIGGGDWSENRIVPDFFRAIRDKKSLNVRNPNSTRPWQHVLESLSGYLNLTMRLHENSNFSGAWNFGPLISNNRNVRELIDGIVKLVEQGNCEYATVSQELHEAKLLNLDVSKSRNELGWRSVLDFDETIKYTAEGYLVQLNNQDVLSSRISQIESYCKRAQELALPWTI